MMLGKRMGSRRSALLSSALFCGIAISIAPSFATENEVPVTTEGMLQRMDRNGDGKVAFEEYRNAMMRRFGGADKNDDGVLRDDEIPQHMVVTQASERSDRGITLDAYTDALQPVFDRFDNNHDGVLDNAELAAYAQARAAMPGEGK